MRKAVALWLVWAAKAAAWFGSALRFFFSFCLFFPCALCSNPVSAMGQVPAWGTGVLGGVGGGHGSVFYQEMVLVVWCRCFGKGWWWSGQFFLSGNGVGSVVQMLWEEILVAVAVFSVRRWFCFCWFCWLSQMLWFMAEDGSFPGAVGDGIQPVPQGAPSLSGS